MLGNGLAQLGMLRRLVAVELVGDLIEVAAALAHFRQHPRQQHVSGPGFAPRARAGARQVVQQANQRAETERPACLAASAIAWRAAGVTRIVGNQAVRGSATRGAAVPKCRPSHACAIERRLAPGAGAGGDCRSIRDLGHDRGLASGAGPAAHAGAHPTGAGLVGCQGRNALLVVSGAKARRWGFRGSKAPLTVDATGHAVAAHPIRAGLGRCRRDRAGVPRRGVHGGAKAPCSGGMQREGEAPPLPSVLCHNTPLAFRRQAHFRPCDAVRCPTFMS